jgi:hypothetical protein
MRKPRSRTYLKSLTSKAVKYYFENPDISLKVIAAKYRINQQMENRLNNSLSKKLINKY